MKSIKILIAAAALVSVLLSGCQKEKVVTGIDSTKACVTDFTYDESMSSTTGVAFYWNGNDAIAAGATSFSVQLAKNPDFSDVDMYNTLIGRTILVTSTPNDGVMFNGLAEYDRYYARIRANYPWSVYSEWTVLKNGDALLCISVGHGLLSMSFGAPEPLEVKAISESKIGASWGMIGLAEGYEYSWKKTADATWSDPVAVTVTSVEILGLDPQTEYDFRVRSFRTTNGEKEYSEYLSGSATTLKSNFIMINAKEDFVALLANGASAAGSDYYKINADLDLAGESLSTLASFAGVLDGQGHTLSNVAVTGNLIDQLTGTVKDIKFSALTISGCLVGNVAVGALVSGVDVAANSSISFPEPTEETNYGVIAARNAGTVEKCTNAAPITMNYAALPKDKSCNWGGVVGYTEGLVSGCSNSGAIALHVDAPGSGTFHTLGGVVGMYKGEPGQSRVLNCVNTGNVSVEYVTAVYFYLGGVVGGTPSAKETPGNYGVAEGCTNEGNVYMHYINGGSGAYSNAGGVVGFVEGAIKGCVNRGKVSIECDSDSATWTCAHLAGVGATVTQGAYDCHNYGQLYAKGLFAGGTDGNRGAGNGTGKPSYWAGVIAAAGPYNSDGSVVFEKCTNEADLELEIGTKTETPNQQCGGVFGYVTGKIVDCHNNGNITITCPCALNRLGGIAGGCKYEVSDCSNKGNLTVIHKGTVKTDWRAFIGGIVADANQAGATTYTNCSNSGKLSFESSCTLSTSKTSCVGGILGGKKSGSEVTFTGCSNTGELSVTSSGAYSTNPECGGDYN